MEDYKQWLQKAEDDTLWAKHSLSGEIYYGCCFASQQAVEKSLKGFLIFHHKPLRKIHDVVALLEDCIKIDRSFEKIRESVEAVYPYYIETRYPSYEEVDQFTRNRAEEAYDHAKTVLAFVKKKLEKYEKETL